MESKSSYKEIAKSTGIFGSSQLVNILLGVVRSKLTAVFLGTLGVGVFGLLQSVVDLIRSFSGLGLETGAVKELAIQKSKNEGKIGETVFIINIWYLGTALLGALLCIVFASPLSYWAFDSGNYIPHIICLSVAVFFIALNAGFTAILQGLRKITFMAMASTLSSAVTLIVMIPVYYIWGIKGIVPVFILSSCITLLISFFFYKKLGIKAIKIPTRTVLKKGSRMLELGVFIVIAGVISTGSLFIARVYISREDGLESVGLFHIAWVIVTLFSGIVLRSSNADFFPRLCSIIDEGTGVRRFVNEQTHFVSFITFPVIIGLIAFAKYVILLLYTTDFVAATETLRWHLAGVFFKILSTPFAFIMLAKNRGGIHLICEIVFWSSYLLTGYLLYPVFNIEAMGIAYLVAYIVYIPTILIAGFKLAKVYWDGLVVEVAVVNSLFIAAIYVLTHYYAEYDLLGGVIIFIIAIIYSLINLRKVIRFGEVIDWLKRRFKR